MNISRRTASAAIALSALVSLSACGKDKPASTAGRSPSGPPTSTRSGSPSTDPTVAASGAATAPVATGVPDGTTVAEPGTMPTVVYYLVEDGARGPLLTREFRRVPKTTAVVRAAVDAMLHLAPLDPDYTSAWPETAKVRGVSIKGDTATVDLAAGSMPIMTGLGSAYESAAQQQLVWTVTAAAPKVARVRLTVDGKTPGSGHVDWSAPQARAGHIDVLAPVQISSPNHAATIRRTLTVTGEAAVFEATVSWSVVDSTSSAVLAQGSAMAAGGAPARGTWQVTAELPASASGRKVEIRAWEASAKDGSVTHLDTKVVTVS